MKTKRTFSLTLTAAVLAASLASSPAMAKDKQPLTQINPQHSAEIAPQHRGGHRDGRHEDRHGRDHGGRHGRGDWARVTHVDPVYRTITVTEPETECWSERVEYPTHRHYNNSAGGAIVGGVVGGVIGNKIGHGKSGATIAGTLIGAAIGHDAARHGGGRGTVSRDERHCETVERHHTERRLIGYDVSYRYRGRHYSTFMEEHPGDRVRVNVDVTPVSY
jgi:uncharacterized protein YcfJ